MSRAEQARETKVRSGEEYNGCDGYEKLRARR